MRGVFRESKLSYLAASSLAGLDPGVTSVAFQISGETEMTPDFNRFVHTPNPFSGR